MLDFFVIRKEDTGENISFITTVYLMYIEDIISYKDTMSILNYIEHNISFMHRIKMFLYMSDDVDYYSLTEIGHKKRIKYLHKLIENEVH